MSEDVKKIGLIVVAAVAVLIAVVVGFRTMGPPQAEVVGELPMPAGGGRDAEAGVVAPTAGADPSGMPAGMAEGR
jgi:hypothetical protein